MFTPRSRLIVLILALLMLVAACSPAAADPVTVVRSYYEAYNANQLDKAMSYIAADALFINPTGSYTGTDEIRASLEAIAAEKLTFNLSNFRNDNGRVNYDYEVLINGEVVEVGDNGLTIVQDGKITFDGTNDLAP